MFAEPGVRVCQAQPRLPGRPSATHRIQESVLGARVVLQGQVGLALPQECDWVGGPQIGGLPVGIQGGVIFLALKVRVSGSYRRPETRSLWWQAQEEQYDYQQDQAEPPMSFHLSETLS